jgi:hypothetical protein
MAVIKIKITLKQIIINKIIIKKQINMENESSDYAIKHAHTHTQINTLTHARIYNTLTHTQTHTHIH